MPSAPRRGRRRPAGCRAGTPCRPRPGRDAPAGRPRPLRRSRRSARNHCCAAARNCAPERARRKLPPSHSTMQFMPSRVSLSQTSELWKAPLRSRKVTKAVTVDCPSSRKFRIASARASGVQFSASRRALERAQHVEARDLLLGVGLQVGGVIDPAEAGLLVGGEHGRAGLGTGSASARPPASPAAATVKMRINKGNCTGFSISRPQSRGRYRQSAMNLNRS